MIDATVDERKYTEHAQPGWHAWDAQSPEKEFCQFIATLQQMLAPTVIIETGVGTGRLTSYLNRTTSQWLGYESQPEWRLTPGCQTTPTPDPTDMARADLIILDSDPAWRIPEINQWANHGKPGSVCIVHDAGNNHPQDDPYLVHNRIRTAIQTTGLPGLYLANPRGGWLARHP